MLLLIDNFDSFSYILADYLRQAGAELKVVRNDVSLEELQKVSYEALILSPGPETPSQAGNLMQILGYYYDKLPVLGICLGHQAIGEFFGAKLTKGKVPVHGKVHEVSKVTEHPLLDGLPDRFKVTRYHSLELKGLPAELQVLLETNSGEVMAIAHRELPLIGIQFHPEAHLTEYGLEILRNCVRIYVEEKRLTAKVELQH
ncbi:aminodeoxychorismate/anthranilate synthase component II [Litoribacter ruber]|uniref:anthranilate synthase component II n=1 Tax=Litoribacter ruber TaxID=702568 RepID=UPI001BD91A8F|nr:aminodeoxychorismate/anthranilate synthase component II [Litoribacter ruber]MBT0809881.1 aminodeoxychorismate/anthranilate synthase component II [Litoribacter ruber]